jgi:hypothetical protein
MRKTMKVIKGIFSKKLLNKNREFWVRTVWYASYLDAEFSVGAMKN